MKKVVLILILAILAAPLHHTYNYHIVKVEKENGWTIINHKGYEIMTTQEINKNVKVEKVKEYIAKIDSECEVLKIVD